MNNPWNLTAREAEAMVATADSGSAMVAARQMGISHKTADELLLRARNRMGAQTRMQAVLMWDRWARAQQ